MRSSALLVSLLGACQLIGCGGDEAPHTDAFVDQAFTHNTPMNPTQAPLGQPLVLYFTVGNSGPDPMIGSTVTVRVSQGLQLISVACIPDPANRAACPPSISATTTSAAVALPSQQAGGFVTIVPVAQPVLAAPGQVSAVVTVDTAADSTPSNNSASVTVQLQ